MATLRPIFPCGLLLIFMQNLGFSETLVLPRMPAPEFVPAVTRGSALSSQEVRLQLQSLLPPGAAVPEDSRPAAGTAQNDDAPHARGEPVVANLGMLPVIHCDDGRYAVLEHTYLPVLLDWFEAMAASTGHTPAGLRDAGYRCNKVARLMRVFCSVRMHRDHDKDPGMAPAIGWCRILLQEDWGRCRKGETHTFVLVATEKGWFVLDPFTRRMRLLTKADPRWVVEFVVL
jgi:hypothetical protein